jgi:hypothetical protein
VSTVREASDDPDYGGRAAPRRARLVVVRAVLQPAENGVGTLCDAAVLDRPGVSVAGALSEGLLFAALGLPSEIGER